MKVLVLGGDGFVGSWIVRRLIEKGFRVVVISRPSSRRNDFLRNDVEYVCSEFNERVVLRKQITGCEIVIHAGPYYPVFSLDRYSQMRQALRELKPVLAESLNAGISKFIFTSSPMVMVTNLKAFRNSTYHFVKRVLHDEVVKWTEMGLPGVTVVPGACFGPGDSKPTTGRVILEIASQRLKFVLDGRMNAVDIRDVADGFVNIIGRGEIGSCYQLGNLNCSFSQFSGLVAHIAGVPAPVIRLPYFPTNVIALGAEWLQSACGARQPLLPRSGLDQIHYGTFLDSSSAVRDLNYTVRPISKTILDTLEYFKSNNYFRPKVAQFHSLVQTDSILDLNKS